MREDQDCYFGQPQGYVKQVISSIYISGVVRPRDINLGDTGTRDLGDFAYCVIVFNFMTKRVPGTVYVNKYLLNELNKWA